jgi:hypothetical protein
LPRRAESAFARPKGWKRPAGPGLDDRGEFLGDTLFDCPSCNGTGQFYCEVGGRRIRSRSNPGKAVFAPCLRDCRDCYGQGVIPRRLERVDMRFDPFERNNRWNGKYTQLRLEW